LFSGRKASPEEVVVVSQKQKNASFRLALIIVLMAGIYGMIPGGVSAETSTETVLSSQASLSSQEEVCSPNSGWIWTNGPSKPDVARQVQQELSQKGIEARVEARSYGETDSCGTYHHHGVDFTLTLVEAESTSRSSQQGLADDVLPVLAEFGKPELGNVKLLSPQGELIPINTSGSFCLRMPSPSKSM
jgi:hypothetical protein